MMLPIGEVVLIRVLFHHGVGGKVRPAVVFDFVAAPVTSQARVSGFDLALEDWQGAE